MGFLGRNEKVVVLRILVNPYSLQVPYLSIASYPLYEFKSPKSILMWTMRQRNRENKLSIIGSIIFVPSRLPRRKALFICDLVLEGVSVFSSPEARHLKLLQFLFQSFSFY